MLGWKIFKHSFLQVTGNFGNALRISGPLWLFTAIIFPIITHSIYAVALNITVTDEYLDFNYVYLAISSVLWVIQILLLIIAGAWISVAWHRYVLTNELNVSIVPLTPRGAVLGYIWKGIMVGLIVTLVAIPIVFVAGLFLGGLYEMISLPIEIVGTTLFAIVMFYLSLRISLILPARALDVDLGIKKSWEHTSKVGGAIWITSTILVLLSFLLNIPIVMAFPTGVVSEILTGVVGWLEMMISISVLTTLYGYCVEGRELAD